VYVAGYEYNGVINIAKVWKNGIAIPLTTGPLDSYASSVYVSGSNVYVAGSTYNGVNGIATTWKNGIPTTLTNGSNDAYAYSIFVK
jgi:hypothetical protein